MQVSYQKILLGNLWKWIGITCLSIEIFGHLSSIIQMSDYVKIFINIWKYYLDEYWQIVANLFGIQLPDGMGAVFSFCIILLSLVVQAIFFNKNRKKYSFIFDWTQAILLSIILMFASFAVFLAFFVGSFTYLIWVCYGIPFILFLFFQDIGRFSERSVFIILVSLGAFALVMTPIQYVEDIKQKYHDAEEIAESGNDRCEHDGVDVSKQEIEECAKTQQYIDEQIQALLPNVQFSKLIAMIVFLSVLLLPYVVSIDVLNERFMFVAVGVSFLLGFNLLSIAMAAT